MFIGESYWELLTDINHWLFEITLIVVFDVIIGMIAYPLFKRWLRVHDEKKHSHEHCEDVHQGELF